MSVQISKGTLLASHKYTRAKNYVVKNSGKKAKTVLIEHPLEPPWTLVAPKEPSEKTRDLYRFAVTAEPGKPATLDVKEERTAERAGRGDEPRRRHDCSTSWPRRRSARR